MPGGNRARQRQLRGAATAAVEQCAPALGEFAPTVSRQPLDGHESRVSPLSSCFTQGTPPGKESQSLLLHFLLLGSGSTLLRDDVFTHWTCPPQACRTPSELARKRELHNEFY